MMVVLMVDLMVEKKETQRGDGSVEMTAVMSVEMMAVVLAAT